MKKNNRIFIMLFFVIMAIVGIGFLKTTPQKVLLVREIDWL